MIGTERWMEFGGRHWTSDVSLTYAAAREEVTLHHPDGHAEVVGADVWQVLGDLLDQGLTAVGYLGYACRRDLPARPSTDIPDAVLLLCEGAQGVPRTTTRQAPSQTSAGMSFSTPGAAEARAASASGTVRDAAPDAYVVAFEQVQQALRAGDSYETNLTYRQTATSNRTPEEIRAAMEPTPYAGMLVHHLPQTPAANAWLISASPERYARIEDGVLETKPIKGTMPRGATAAEDEAHAELLRTDPRFRAENLMITDLLRNDVGQVCEAATVEVPQLMAVESYAGVHQLVTTVRGRLRAGVSALDAVHALFPAGSMTGAPKRRTMEIIDRVEAGPAFGGPRGAYAGAFGVLCRDSADLGVVIRSLTSPDGRTWTLGTGGGITVRSDADSEWLETRWKMARLLAALGR